MPLGKQLVRDLGMPLGTRELVDDLVVPIEAEPLEPVENGLDRLVC
jgi:hypothetical protein